MDTRDPEPAQQDAPDRSGLPARDDAPPYPPFGLSPEGPPEETPAPEPSAEGEMQTAPSPVPPVTEPAMRREILERILESTPPEQLSEALEPYQPSEIAEALEWEALERQLATLRALPDERGLAIFDYFDPESQAALLAEFKEWRARRYLAEMSPDARADLFAELPANLAKRFLELLPPDERKDVQELLVHKSNTAGGLMTTDFAWVTPDLTIAEVIEVLRRDFRDVEMIYYIYVLDADDKLVGLLSMRFLLLADPRAVVKDVMFTNIIRMREDTDQEILAQELALYDFVAMPIVDANDRMVGIVTFDDVVDVLESEAAEDQDLFAGMSPSKDDYVDQTIPQGLRQRLPWLLMFMVLSSGSTFLLDWYEKNGYMDGFFKGVMILLPMIMATAGNAATQTATLVIRAINVRDIAGRDVGRVIAREMLLGFSMGLVLSLVAFSRGWVAAVEDPLLLASAFGAIMVMVLTVSTGIGAALPLLFRAMRLDPAVMSSPFIATFIDVVVTLLCFQVSIMVYQFHGLL